MNTDAYQIALPHSDFHNRPGSLLLRGDDNNYGRCTLISNWHQNREGYPKDYDFNVAPKRNLKVSSYRNLANVTDGKETGQTIYETTHNDDVFQSSKKYGSHEPMITRDTYKQVDIDRELGKPRHGYGYLLPRHRDDHYKMHLITSYMAHFGPPNPFTAEPIKPLDYPDLSPAYRKSKSQFTDPDGLRPGKNTWHDESGFYTNSHFKRQLFKICDPIRKLNYYETTRPSVAQ